MLLMIAFERPKRAKRESYKTLPLSHRGRAQQQTESKYGLTWLYVHHSDRPAVYSHT